MEKNYFDGLKTITTYYNEKLGDGIIQCNMPNLITCSVDAPCRKGCYCNKGHMLLTRKNHIKRYNAYMQNPDLFFNKIDIELQCICFKFFRWHSSGDIVDKRYFAGMVDIAKKHKKIKFLAFTKKYEIVNEYLNSGKKIPKNLKIVFSTWGKGWEVPNPYNLPCSYVEYHKEEFDSIIPANAFRCGGLCAKCVKGKVSCWTLKEGESVVFEKH